MIAPRKAVLRRKKYTSRDLLKIVRTKEEGYCNGITECDVSENSITRFRFLKPFVDLTALNVSYNVIGTLKSKFLPTTLTTLNVSYNKLENLDGIETLTNLTDLDVSHNHITDISAIEQCLKMRSINFHGNHLTGVEGLSTLKKLRTLSLSRNKISSIQTLHPLAHNTSLVNLELSGNPLTSGGNYRISIFHMLPHIQVLDGNTTPGLNARVRAQLTPKGRKALKKQTSKRARAVTPTSKRLLKQIAKETALKGKESRTPQPSSSFEADVTLNETQNSIESELKMLDEKLHRKRAFGWAESSIGQKPTISVGRNVNSPLATRPGTAVEAPRENIGTDPLVSQKPGSHISGAGREQEEGDQPFKSINKQAWSLMSRIDYELERIKKRETAKKDRAQSPASSSKLLVEMARKGALDESSQDDGSTMMAWPSPRNTKTMKSAPTEDSTTFSEKDDTLMMGLAYALMDEGDNDPSGNIQKLSFEKKLLEKMMYKFRTERAERMHRRFVARQALRQWKSRLGQRKNKKLEARLRKRIRTTSTLWSIGVRFWQCASKEIDFSRFLREIITATDRLFPTSEYLDPALGKAVNLRTHVALYLLEDDKDLLLINAEGNIAQRCTLKDSIAGYVCKVAKMVVISDATEHEEFNSSIDCNADTRFLKDRTSNLKPRMVCMPILRPEGSKMEVMGVLQAYGLHTKPFEDEDLKLVSGFAAQVAVGLAVINRINLAVQDLATIRKALGEDYKEATGERLKEVLDNLRHYRTKTGAVAVSSIVGRVQHRVIKECFARLKGNLFSTTDRERSASRENAMKSNAMRALFRWRDITRATVAKSSDVKNLEEELQNCSEEKDFAMKMLAKSRKDNKELAEEVERLRAQVKTAEKAKESAEAARALAEMERDEAKKASAHAQNPRSKAAVVQASTDVAPSSCSPPSNKLKTRRRSSFVPPPELKSMKEVVAEAAEDRLSRRKKSVVSSLAQSSAHRKMMTALSKWREREAKADEAGTVKSPKFSASRINLKGKRNSVMSTITLREGTDAGTPKAGWGAQNTFPQEATSPTARDILSSLDAEMKAAKQDELHAIKSEQSLSTTS